MTDNLKTRIAEAIFPYLDGNLDSEQIAEAAQAVLDIMGPLFPEYKEFMGYRETKRMMQENSKSFQELAAENFQRLTKAHPAKE